MPMPTIRLLKIISLSDVPLIQMVIVMDGIILLIYQKGILQGLKAIITTVLNQQAAATSLGVDFLRHMGSMGVTRSL